MTPAEVIRAKRDGHALDDAQIDAFVRGLVDRTWSEGQVAALAMAILLRGMRRDECVALTRAMTLSGQVLDWSRAGLPGPIVDKHSTGGVGDKVSLMLAPIVAACGAVVPMISGRGLGHTGGTLDKMQSLPGYDIAPSRRRLTATLRQAGCAIVGATSRLAPADRRLYAVRDVTATVESVALITASILSKKLAAGLQGLVMDVKVGNGAFCRTPRAARTLAASLVDVARHAGLPTRAMVTDMNSVLGRTVGNALEMNEAVAFLAGRGPRDARLEAVTMGLAAEMLLLVKAAPDRAGAESMARLALDSGEAAERFSRMVASLGGPGDVCGTGLRCLARAPVVMPLNATRPGFVAAMDTRAVGQAVVDLGGGRRVASDTVDPAVGLSDVLPVGTRVAAGDTLLMVHAPSRDAARRACAALTAAIHVTSRRAPAGGPLIEALSGGKTRSGQVRADS